MGVSISPSGDVYRYFDFPEDEYGEFLNTESHGRYFLGHIRDRLRYERLAKLRTPRSRRFPPNTY